jgi:ferredoxin
MKIKAHQDKCTGHARCAAVAPHIFELDDDGFTAIDEITVAEEDQPLALRAVRACPERALEIIED